MYDGQHREEGWYSDPWDRHEARWFSDGRPTPLVRDGHVESHDDPPADDPRHAPIEIEPEANFDGTDLRRADEAESGEQSVTASDYRAAGWNGAVPHWGTMPSGG